MFAPPTTIYTHGPGLNKQIIKIRKTFDLFCEYCIIKWIKRGYNFFCLLHTIYTFENLTQQF
jgi:hypothetical protein